MCWLIKEKKIKNDDIQDKVGVASMVDKLGSEVEMIWTYEKENCRCPCEEVRNVGNSRH